MQLESLDESLYSLESQTRRREQAHTHARAIQLLFSDLSFVIFSLLHLMIGLVFQVSLSMYLPQEKLVELRMLAAGSLGKIFASVSEPEG